MKKKIAKLPININLPSIRCKINESKLGGLFIGTKSFSGIKSAVISSVKRLGGGRIEVIVEMDNEDLEVLKHLLKPDRVMKPVYKKVAKTSRREGENLLDPRKKTT